MQSKETNKTEDQPEALKFPPHNFLVAILYSSSLVSFFILRLTEGQMMRP